MKIADRSEFATEYTASDGSRVVRVSTQPLAVEQPDGSWTDVEPRLKSEDSGWGVQAHPLDPEFADGADRRDAVVLHRDGHRVSFSLVGAAKGHLESPFWFWDNWSQLAYRDVADGTDLTYDVLPGAVKESVLLKKQPRSKHTWTWNLNPGDLTPRLTDEDVLELVDGDGTVVMWSPTPVAWDSSQTRGDVPREQITLDAGLRQAADGSWTYSVSVDPTWLQSTDRVYPVVIDPAITVSPVNQNSYKSNGATYAGQLHVGNTAESGGNYYWRGVENFAGGDSVGKLIEGADLGIGYVTGATGSFTGAVRVATGWCYTCLGTSLGNYTLGSASASLNGATFQKYIASQFGGGATNVAFILSGAEGTTYSYKQIVSDLWVQYHAQISPAFVTGSGASPANGATGVSLTPTFKSTATGISGSSLAYSFRVGLDAAFTPSLMVYQSPASSSSTLKVPEGTLKPGNEVLLARIRA